MRGRNKSRDCHVTTLLAMTNTGNRPARRNCLRIIVSAKIVARCCCRGRACPAQKGRSKRRAVQWLFAADRQFHGTRFQVGSVSALASWHDSFPILSFETVSGGRPLPKPGKSAPGNDSPGAFSKDLAESEQENPCKRRQEYAYDYVEYAASQVHF